MDGLYLKDTRGLYLINWRWWSWFFFLKKLTLGIIFLNALLCTLLIEVPSKKQKKKLKVMQLIFFCCWWTISDFFVLWKLIFMCSWFLERLDFLDVQLYLFILFSLKCISGFITVEEFQCFFFNFSVLN